MINWKNNSLEEAELIFKIAERALLEIPSLDSFITIEMDITACHLNGNPLKLQELLSADKSNFIHDVLGINKYINRKTGKLENCFVPRFSE